MGQSLVPAADSYLLIADRSSLQLACPCGELSAHCEIHSVTLFWHAEKVNQTVHGHPLGTEAPIMTPAGMDSCIFFLLVRSNGATMQLLNA